MEITALQPTDLVHFLTRIRKFDVDRYENYFHTLLINVLSELLEFVPSEGAVVLVDNPVHKHDAQKEGELTYLATAGQKVTGLLGKATSPSLGVIGETYTLGKSAVRKAEKSEKLILDKKNYPYEVASLISVPLKIEASVVGVLQVFNKKETIGFTIRDLKLVEIFGGYLSTSLQNAIDARKAKELSKKDDLTGLYNDRYFHQQLEVEIARADEKRHPLTLLFMDLDNFKSVNDQHGHLVGSQTLREIGFILREAVDTVDATMARYGGDEYVVIFPGVTLEHAFEIADRIRMMIASKLFMIDCGERNGSFVNFKGILSCSTGLASLHDHVPAGDTPKGRKDLLIRLADRAMYKAKELGKNRVCVAEVL